MDPKLACHSCCALCLGHDDLLADIAKLADIADASYVLAFKGAHCVPGQGDNRVRDGQRRNVMWAHLPACDAAEH